MSLLKQRLVDDVLRGTRERAAVGHNRELGRTTDGGFIFALYGHPVVRTKNGFAEFDPCGFLTNTTASAMKDGARVFNVGEIAPSFSGGRFRITYCGITYLPGPDGAIRLPLPR